MKNNRATIVGTFASKCEYSHTGTKYGERFFRTELMTPRTSGVIDTVPVLLPERLLNLDEEMKWETVKVTGEFRSRNADVDGKRRLLLYVFADSLEAMEPIDCDWENHLELRGFLCKEPVYRETPRGRQITDLLLAVNRTGGRSDYIPCIAWERDARDASKLAIGTSVALVGRIQSRDYTKRMEDGTVKERTAYEVSISKMETGWKEDFVPAEERTEINE